MPFADSYTESQSSIPMTFTCKPFVLSKGYAPPLFALGQPNPQADEGTYQSVLLKDFEGASIHVDLKAVGSAQQPEFLCRLRIDSIQKKVVATATEDLIVREQAPSEWEINQLTVAQIKERLRERGEAESMRGFTLKSHLRALLQASDERRRLAQPGKVVAREGQTGIVVKPLHRGSDGHERIGVNFGRGCINVFPSQVKLGQPVPVTDEGEEIGEGSAIQVVGGVITFKKSIFDQDGHDYFLSSSRTPAAPGVLVPWQKAFRVGCDKPDLFKLGEIMTLKLHAKLQMVFARCSVNSRFGDDAFETPQPKAKRARMD
eukprot:TRINITY_DN19054_c0_g1_i1.p1 TRINITY_DN19054_c0_g1~~TRINITY_DN19054_c0_g1_i1.p1  ORF type:complete len:317 (-),score=66.50 TRINITY_DN19054_c0_g1_i1:237-1187(-)